jgi:hypothetical protein
LAVTHLLLANPCWDSKQPKQLQNTRYASASDSNREFDSSQTQVWREGMRLEQQQQQQEEEKEETAMMMSL